MRASAATTRLNPPDVRAVRVGQAGERVLAHVLAQARDVEPRARRRPCRRRAERNATPVFPTLPVSLPPADRIGDLPRVDELVGRGEQLDALEEERPLLGVEEREALVHRHLRGVGLHLAEVGVHRGVERHVREAEAQVRARPRRRSAAYAKRPSVCRAPFDRGRHERLELGDDAALQVVEPFHRAGLGEEARHALRVGPRVLAARCAASCAGR